MKKPYRILAINGSHRQERGISAVLLDQFLQGSRAAGAEVEILYPGRLRIGTCKACYTCIFKTPGVCFQHDDMERVLSGMNAADLLLFAVPVYFDTMPSDLMKIIERLMPTLGPIFEFRDGRTYHLAVNSSPRDVVTILLSGNPELESLASLQRTFRRFAANMGHRLKGEFLFPTSQMVVDDAVLLKGQLDALRQAGEEIVRYKTIRPETHEAVNSPYVTDFAADIAHKNKAFAALLRQFQSSSGTEPRKENASCE